MQRLLVTIAIVATIALFAPLSKVEAQSNTDPAIAPASRTINLTAEQRFIIKEIVLKHLNVPKARAGAPETIGDPVPSSVDISTRERSIAVIAIGGAPSTLRSII